MWVSALPSVFVRCQAGQELARGYPFVYVPCYYSTSECGARMRKRGVHERDGAGPVDRHAHARWFRG